MDISCTEMKVRFISAMLVILMIQKNNAQDNFSGSMQPQVTLEYKITPTYSHTNGLEERHFYNKNGKNFWKTQQLDLFHFSQLRILDNQTLALGLQYRFREIFDKKEKDELRFTEQYAFSKRGYSVRYGHRARLEQRISDRRTTHRFRYRFMIDFPLGGLTLDINEIYLAIGSESLLSMASFIKPEWDQRLLLDFGWFITNNITIEIGVEHRIENYTRQVKQKLFLNSGINFSL